MFKSRSWYSFAAAFSGLCLVVCLINDAYFWAGVNAVAFAFNLALAASATDP